MFTHPLLARSPVALERDTQPRNHPLPAILRLLPDAPRSQKPGPGNDLNRDDQLARVEAVLIAADEPLALKRLVAAAALPDAGTGRRLISRLIELYDRDGTAFQVREVAGGYQLQTRPEYHPWLARLRRGHTDLKLTPAARETLTIVAYRQPITRADVEAVRGVQSGEVLRQLMEKSLVRIAGREDSLGRPVLYATTRKFLQVYGLNSLKDLPMAEAMLVEKSTKSNDTQGSAAE